MMESRRFDVKVTQGAASQPALEKAGAQFRTKLRRLSGLIDNPVRYTIQSN
jgi:hypothetical protein